MAIATSHAIACDFLNGRPKRHCPMGKMPLHRYMSISEPERTVTHWPDGTSEVPMEPVERVIFASMCDVQGPVLDEMRRIREHALGHNGPQGISVMLLNMCGWFVEWIEGPGPAVDALLVRVAQDTRHHGLKVIHRSFGRPRLFKPWIGSIVQSSESTRQFVQRVMAQLKRHNEGEEIEPAAVWWQLCAPSTPDMPRPHGHNPRVMLLSAQGTQVFDLLEWLARDKQRNLVRRRFAGGVDDAPDVESDYLDLPEHGPRGLRLIANARKGLAMGMPHAFLPEYAAVALLLDGSASRNRRIVERVLAACQQVHHSPVIVGLGSRSCVTPELQDLVERQGLPWLGAATEATEPNAAEQWRALEPALLQLG